MNRKHSIRSACLYSLLILSLQPTFAENLHQAVADTVMTNPDIRIIAKTRNASNEGVAQARSGYFPTVDVNAGFGRDRGDNINTGFTYSTLWRTDFGLVAKQNLFDGFATKYEVIRNKAKTNADAFKVRGTAQDTALFAIQAYLDILRTQELVALAEKNVAAHDRTAYVVRRMGEQGLGRLADTDQTSGRLDLARANLVTARNNLQDAYITFQKVVGHMPVGPLDAPPDVGAAFLPTSVMDAIDKAIKNHPTLKSAGADIAEARGQFMASKSKFYPHLDFVVRDQRNHNVSGVPGPDTDLSAMLELNWNLLQGGKDMARTRETAWNMEEAIEIRNRTYRQVVETISLSWRAYQNASARMPYLIQHRNKSRLTVGAYGKQFELGKRTILDVLDSQNELFTSEQDLVNERYSLLFAKYRLLNGMGILTEFLHVPLPIEACVPYGPHELC